MFKKFYINTKGKIEESLQLSDEEIILRYKTNHDIEYVGQLFERYTHLVFGICMKYLKSETEAEDATLEIFEDLFDKLEKNEITNFKSWLYSVSKNFCLMYLRKQNTEIRKLENFYKNKVDMDVDFSEEIHLNGEENNCNTIEKLKIVLNSLNNEQKCCIQLMYFENKSYNEISDLTGYTLKQVKSYIQNGKRNLKNLLTK